MMDLKNAFVLAVIKDRSHGCPAYTDTATSWRSAAKTVKYHLHLVKKGHSFQDDIHCLPDLKPRSLRAQATSQNDLDALDDALPGESFAVGKATTETSAALRR